jgi:hypothetical protein
MSNDPIVLSPALITCDEIESILSSDLEVTDEWGGSKLAAWQFGAHTQVAGIEEAAKNIFDAIEARMSAEVKAQVEAARADSAAYLETARRAMEDKTQHIMEDSRPLIFTKVVRNTKGFNWEASATTRGSAEENLALLKQVTDSLARTYGGGASAAGGEES